VNWKESGEKVVMAKFKPPSQHLEDTRKTTKMSVRIAHDLRFELGIS
jgi:hypothetical protein